MKKIIIDTNIIVSAAINLVGIPARIITDIIGKDKVIVCVSEPIWAEYDDVLRREKFSKIPNFYYNAELYVSLLKDKSEMTEQPNVVVERLKDTSDNKFLELAYVAEADFLITGNTKHFNLDFFGKTRIVTPTEFWELFKTE